MARGDVETLAIPGALRDEVDERDQGMCRVCGRHAGQRALHHIRYGGDAQGMGGRRLHRLDNLVTVGWLFDHDCHTLVHRRKHLWLPVLAQAAVTPGVTALQLLRWRRRQLS